MYPIGSSHPYRDEARRALETLALAGKRLLTTVEVVPEVIPRSAATRRSTRRFQAMLDLVDEVFPVTLGDALRAPGRDSIRLAAS